MCQLTKFFDCGHQQVEDSECTRSHKKGGLGNLLKYALFEEPCTYNSLKRRHRLCDACEGKYKGVKEYMKAKRDGERGEHRGERYEHRERRHRDEHVRSSDRSNGHREQRRREHSDSSNRSPPKALHSSRSHSSRHNHEKSSREPTKRGRSRVSRPRESMLTIDESAPLPPRQIHEDCSADIADTSLISMSEMRVRDDGSSINDFRDFIQAAERTEAVQQRARGNPAQSKPTETRSRFVEHCTPVSPIAPQDFTNVPPQPVSPLIPEEPLLPGTTYRPASSLVSEAPRPASSVYRPAREDWKPQPGPERQDASRYQGWRPASSIYSQVSVPLVRVPEPPWRGSKRPQLEDDHISYVTQYASDCSLVQGSSMQESTPPTSNNTTPRKPRGSAQVSASTVTLRKVAGELSRMVRDDMPGELREEMRGNDDAFTIGPMPHRSGLGVDNQPIDPNCKLGKSKRALRPGLQDSVKEARLQRQFEEKYNPPSPDLGPRNSLDSPEDEHPQRKRRGNANPPMMHFTTYRDPNSTKAPPKPTPSSTGSQVFMKPRHAPRPPFASFSSVHDASNEAQPARLGQNPLLSVDRLSAHRRPRDSNISTQTRWSALYAQPPNKTIATHNGQPVHVVNPEIVQKSWKGVDGPSPGKVSSPRPTTEKKSSSDRVKGFISRLRPQESEASFACVEAKRIDSFHEEEKRESKKSGKSSDSKGKHRR